MSSIVNKIKEVVHSDKSHQGAPEGTHGPHNSRVANAADPRVDSDRDGSHNMSSGTTGRTANPLGSSTTTGRTAGPMGSSHTSGTSEGAHGPHNSRVANAMDPRVDSDRDGSNTMGNTGAGRTANPFGSSTTTGRTANPLGSSHTSGTSEGAHGPHNSRVANAMDPRVDSDRDGSKTTGGTGGMGMGNFGSTGMTGTTGAGGFGSGTHGMTGTHGSSGMTGMTGTHGASAGTHGPHNSRVGNTLDPRVDSDRDGRGALGTGPGPAPNTAGPHKSDMMNKVDPRVDSDLDGSKTMGGNKTYGQSSAIRDPTDAAQAPPSVVRAHLGEPIIEHDDKHHHRERRNSVKSHQEAFRGI